METFKIISETNKNELFDKNLKFPISNKQKENFLYQDFGHIKQNIELSKDMAELTNDDGLKLFDKKQSNISFSEDKRNKQVENVKTSIFWPDFQKSTIEKVKTPSKTTLEQVFQKDVKKIESSLFYQLPKPNVMENKNQGTSVMNFDKEKDTIGSSSYVEEVKPANLDKFKDTKLDTNPLDLSASKSNNQKGTSVMNLDKEKDTIGSSSYVEEVKPANLVKDTKLDTNPLDLSASKSKNQEEVLKTTVENKTNSYVSKTIYDHYTQAILQESENFFTDLINNYEDVVKTPSKNSFVDQDFQKGVKKIKSSIFYQLPEPYVLQKINQGIGVINLGKETDTKGSSSHVEAKLDLFKDTNPLDLSASKSKNQEEVENPTLRTTVENKTSSSVSKSIDDHGTQAISQESENLEFSTDLITNYEELVKPDLQKQLKIKKDDFADNGVFKSSEKETKQILNQQNDTLNCPLSPGNKQYENKCSGKDNNKNKLRVSIPLNLLSKETLSKIVKTKKNDELSDVKCQQDNDNEHLTSKIKIKLSDKFQYHPYVRKLSDKQQKNVKSLNSNDTMTNTSTITKSKSCTSNNNLESLKQQSKSNQFNQSKTSDLNKKTKKTLIKKNDMSISPKTLLTSGKKVIQKSDNIIDQSQDSLNSLKEKELEKFQNILKKSNFCNPAYEVPNENVNVKSANIRNLKEVDLNKDLTNLIVSLTNKKIVKSENKIINKIGSDNKLDIDKPKTTNQKSEIINISKKSKKQNSSISKKSAVSKEQLNDSVCKPIILNLKSKTTKAAKIRTTELSLSDDDIPLLDRLKSLKTKSRKNFAGLKRQKKEKSSYRDQGSKYAKDSTNSGKASKTSILESQLIKQDKIESIDQNKIMKKNNGNLSNKDKTCQNQDLEMLKCQLIKQAQIELFDQNLHNSQSLSKLSKTTQKDNNFEDINTKNDSNKLKENNSILPNQDIICQKQDVELLNKNEKQQKEEILEKSQEKTNATPEITLSRQSKLTNKKKDFSKDLLELSLKEERINNLFNKFLLEKNEISLIPLKTSELKGNIDDSLVSLSNVKEATAISPKSEKIKEGNVLSQQIKQDQFSKSSKNLLKSTRELQHKSKSKDKVPNTSILESSLNQLENQNSMQILTSNTNPIEVPFVSLSNATEATDNDLKSSRPEEKKDKVFDINLSQQMKQGQFLKSGRSLTKSTSQLENKEHIKSASKDNIVKNNSFSESSLLQLEKQDSMQILTSSTNSINVPNVEKRKRLNQIMNISKKLKASNIVNDKAKLNSLVRAALRQTEKHVQAYAYEDPIIYSEKYVLSKIKELLYLFITDEDNSLNRELRGLEDEIIQELYEQFKSYALPLLNSNTHDNLPPLLSKSDQDETLDKPLTSVKNEKVKILSNILIKPDSSMEKNNYQSVEMSSKNQHINEQKFKTKKMPSSTVTSESTKNRLQLSPKKTLIIKDLMNRNVLDLDKDIYDHQFKHLLDTKNKTNSKNVDLNNDKDLYKTKESTQTNNPQTEVLKTTNQLVALTKKPSEQFSITEVSKDRFLSPKEQPFFNENLFKNKDNLNTSESNNQLEEEVKQKISNNKLPDTNHEKLLKRKRDSDDKDFNLSKKQKTNDVVLDGEIQKQKVTNDGTLNSSAEKFKVNPSGKLTNDEVRLLPSSMNETPLDLSFYKKNQYLKYNSFRRFRNLISTVSRNRTHRDNITALFREFFKINISLKSPHFNVHLWCKFLIPTSVKRDYHVSRTSLASLLGDLFECTTVINESISSKKFNPFKSKEAVAFPVKETFLTLPEVDEFLDKLAGLQTHQQRKEHFIEFIKKCNQHDIKMIIYLIFADLKMDATTQNILDGLHPHAYELYLKCNDLNAVIDYCLLQKPLQ